MKTIPELSKTIKLKRGARRTLKRLDQTLRQACPDAVIQFHTGIYNGRQGRPAVSVTFPGLPFHLVVNMSLNGKEIEAWTHCLSSTRTIYKGDPDEWIRQVETEGLGL